MTNALTFLITLSVIPFTTLRHSAYQSICKDTAEKVETIQWTADYVSVSPDTLGYYNAYLRTLTYFRGGVARWTIGLPHRMQQRTIKRIFTRERHVEPAPGNKNLSIDINTFKERFLRCPEAIFNDGIAIADMTGFLILDKKTGRILLDRPDEKSMFDRFPVNFTGHPYTIKMKHRSCSGSLNPYGQFISECGKYIFHMDGNELLVFKNKKQLVERIEDAEFFYHGSGFRNGVVPTLLIKSKSDLFEIILEGGTLRK